MRKIENIEIKDFLNYHRQTYIFGESIPTSIGDMRFLTYKEYMTNYHFINNISKNVLHLHYQLLEISKKTKKKDGREDLIEYAHHIKDLSLYEVVANNRELLQAYVVVFSLVMGEKEVEDMFSTEDNFVFCRELFLDMNLIKEEEVSPNPEIQKTIEMSKKAKQASSKNRGASPTDIVTSVVVGAKQSFKDVSNMTVFQIMSLFQRYGAIKNYDTTVLFRTVNDDVDISPWDINFDMFEDSSTTAIKRSEFDQRTKDIF